MKTTFVIIILGIMISGCANGNPMDPSDTKSGFKGITYTNSAGDFLGPIDGNDWHLFRGSDSYGLFPYQTPIDSYWGGDGKIAFHAHAWPNPSADSFFIHFRLSGEHDWIVCIVDEDYQRVKELSGHSSNDFIVTVWDGLDYHGQKVPDGMYRVLYTIGEYSGHGDIWVTANDISWWIDYY